MIPKCVIIQKMTCLALGHISIGSLIGSEAPSKLSNKIGMIGFNNMSFKKYKEMTLFHNWNLQYT